MFFMDLFNAVLGLVFGVLLIFYRENVALYLKESYENSGYREGKKMFGLKGNIRPLFILLLGVIISLLAVFRIILNNINN